MRGFFEARWIVATLLAVLCAGATACCVLGHPKFASHELIACAGALAISLAVSVAHLRHVLLAIATAFAPAPGLLAAASFLHGLHSHELLLAHLLGFALALFLADEIAIRVADGAGPAEAVSAAIVRNLTAMLAAIFLAAVLPGALFLMGVGASIPVALTESAADVSALVVLPLAAALVFFGEETVARINRLRELRERVFEFLTSVGAPRWGWSVTGIAGVFFALAFFGAKTLRVTPALVHSTMLLPVVAIALASALLAGAIATHDWRRMIGVAIALASVDAIGAWGYARENVALTSGTWLALLQVLGAAGAMIILVANAARPEPGEDTVAASARALVGKAGVALAAVLAAVAILLVLSLDLGGEGVALAVAMLFAWPAAILFQPALTIAVEWMIPRRSTIEARYRVS